MIVSRQQSFKLKQQYIVEKLVVKAPFRYSAVFGDEACFIYVKNGAAKLSSPEEKLQITAAESVLLKCGSYFADIVRSTGFDTCEILAIHLHPDVLAEIYKSDMPAGLTNQPQNGFVKKITASSVFAHFVDSLLFYFDNPALVNEELIILKLKELMHLLLQSDKAETISALLSFLFDPRKAALQKIIDTHLYSNLNVNQLAALSGQSLSSFKRAFQAQFNDTPANYIKRKKVEKAADLLSSSTLSISEICYQTGFNDPSHFSRSFSQLHGRSPSAYRKTVKKG